MKRREFLAAAGSAAAILGTGFDGADAAKETAIESLQFSPGITAGDRSIITKWIPDSLLKSQDYKQLRAGTHRCLGGEYSGLCQFGFARARPDAASPLFATDFAKQMGASLHQFDVTMFDTLEGSYNVTLKALDQRILQRDKHANPMVTLATFTIRYK